MRVTIAASACLVACLAALLRPDAASAADGSGRPLPTSVCGEPTRLLELASFSDAPGGIGISVAASDIAVVTVSPAPGDVSEADSDAETTTLWCVSPDDPRCSPLERSASSNFSLAGAKLGCAFDWSLGVMPPLASAADSGRSQALGSARDGVLGRLDRPPRSTRV